MTAFDWRTLGLGEWFGQRPMMGGGLVDEVLVLATQRIGFSPQVLSLG